MSTLNHDTCVTKESLELEVDSVKEDSFVEACVKKYFPRLFFFNPPHDGDCLVLCVLYYLALAMGKTEQDAKAWVEMIQVDFKEIVYMIRAQVATHVLITRLAALGPPPPNVQVTSIYTDGGFQDPRAGKRQSPTKVKHNQAAADHEAYKAKTDKIFAECAVISVGGRPMGEDELQGFANIFSLTIKVVSMNCRENSCDAGSLSNYPLFIPVMTAAGQTANAPPPTNGTMSILHESRSKRFSHFRCANGDLVQAEHNLNAEHESQHGLPSALYDGMADKELNKFLQNSYQAASEAPAAEAGVSRVHCESQHGLSSAMYDGMADKELNKCMQNSYQAASEAPAAEAGEQPSANGDFGPIYYTSGSYIVPVTCPQTQGKCVFSSPTPILGTSFGTTTPAAPFILAPPRENQPSHDTPAQRKNNPKGQGYRRREKQRMKMAQKPI